MSEYRRFVSYMYEYTNGKKNKNTGFAKVESRNGICRMQIHLQKIPQEEETLNIYGFVREGGWLLGIFLGQIGVKNACGDARIQTRAKRIGGSDYPLEQIAGLWVESGLGRTYLTVFDDEGVDTEKLVTALPEEEPQEEVLVETEETREEAPVETEEQKEWREEAGVEAEEEPREEAGVEAKEEPQEEAPVEIEEQKEPQEEETQREISVETEEQKEPPEEIRAEENQEKPEESGIEQEGTAPVEEPHAGEEQVHAQQAEAYPAMNSRCANCSWHMANLNQKWQALSRRYPHFQPFADGEFADCLQITPRELAFIGQGKCRVGNNSFLMHGFCNYRHLLFGKRRDGRFVLGVPGIFENQEMVMANMHGFPDFKEAMAKHPNGRFGYWCREL